MEQPVGVEVAVGTHWRRSSPAFGEGDETFLVNLSGASGGAITDATG